MMEIIPFLGVVGGWLHDLSGQSKVLLVDVAKSFHLSVFQYEDLFIIGYVKED